VSASTAKGFSIVVAMDSNRGIGKDGKLPWKLSGDMKFFRELTTCPDREAVEKRWGMVESPRADVLQWMELREALKAATELPKSDQEQNLVIMGRRTWESLPDNYRPLPDRGNVALSRGGVVSGPLKDYDGLPSLLEASASSLWNQIFVIGGGQVFSSSLSHPSCAHLYITEIDAVFDCDTFFPETPGFHPVLSSPWIEETRTRYRFRRYDRVS
jgi:dihydrofolate reductase/thymidylate synthase